MIDLDQAWIEKYRAALEATPPPPSLRWQRLVDGFNYEAVRGKILAKIGALRTNMARARARRSARENKRSRRFSGWKKAST